MKSFTGQGLNFLDTALMIPGTLDSIGKTMFKGQPEKQKFANETIKNLTLDKYTELSTEDRAEITRYCQQDAYVVKEIASKFFKNVYSTYFGDNAFLRRPFYHSAAALAWDVWKDCFLQTDVHVNKQAMEFERLSYRGGLTLVFRTICKLGFSIDINSSYPAAMCNYMPIVHLLCTYLKE